MTDASKVITIRRWPRLFSPATSNARPAVALVA
jgi:hypothetical protein